MTLTPVDLLRKEIREVFENSLNNLYPTGTEIIFDYFFPSKKTSSTLLYNIVDNTKNESGGYVIELFVPGFTKENIEIYQENNYVKITGKLPERNVKYLRKEYSLNDFEKVFELRKGYEVKSVTLENGILRIHLDLRESEKPKKIEIKG